LARISRTPLLRSAVLLGMCVGLVQIPAVAPAHTQVVPTHVPQLDHVIVVVLENHSYTEVYSSPYITSMRDSGATMDDCHAEAHPSQPNYLGLWSGSKQGTTDDACPPPGSPYTAENLGHACEMAGLTWKAYSEDLPSVGYTGCVYNTHGYTRNHAPWTDFSNLNHSNERPYSELALAESLGTLPNLAFVIPNKCNDAHDCPVSTADAWLAANVPGMLRALGPKGVLILTADEDDHTESNRILTTFNGHLVTHGYVSHQHVNHYTILRTICDALGLAPFGAAATESPIIDIWNVDPVSVKPTSWGAVKSFYR
jgi:hypothetical protein